MDQVLTRSTMAARGLTDADLARSLLRGDLERVRRGAYARPVPEERTLEEQHLLVLRATVPLLDPGTVLSHGSAAVVQRLPVWPEAVDRVHVTRPRQGGGRRRTAVYRHSSPLSPDEVVRVDGWNVTILARTVVDLARTRPLEQAVAAVDAALSRGVSADELAMAVAGAARWPGAAAARRAVALGDGRAESAGESVSRVLLVDLGVPEFQPQLPVVHEGSVVARVDFGWADQRVVAEFDGKVKYGRLLKRGQDVSDVLFREKQREDMLRDLGWEVVRWVWADLNHPEVIAERLRRAFLRARRR
jgi:very-short-patch-repair endonuclease